MYPVIIIFFVVLLIGGIAGKTAFAEDGKLYPGNACRPLYGSQGDNLRSYSGDLTNYNQDSRRLICPIVRDNMSGSKGNRQVYVRVHRHTLADAAVTCTLYSRHAFSGAVTASHFGQYTTSGGNGNISLSINKADALSSELIQQVGALLPRMTTEYIDYEGGSTSTILYLAREGFDFPEKEVQAH